MADKQALVNEVKNWQRKSEGHKQAWYKFCADQGSGDYDPAKHELSVLQTFISMGEAGQIEVDESAQPAQKRRRTGGGMMGMGMGWNPMMMMGMGDPRHMKLVDQVKAYQRKGESEKNAWYNYVKKQGHTTFDPMMHDVAGLRRFLDYVNNELVQRVKEFQKRSPGHQEAWQNFCKGQGSDNYDPGRHDDASLKSFLEMADAGQVEVVEPAATPDASANKQALIDEVKKWQKISAGHKEAWYAFVLMQEGGENVNRNFDPKLHDDATLQQFLEKTKNGEIKPRRGHGGKGGGKGDMMAMMSSMMGMPMMSPMMGMGMGMGMGQGNWGSSGSSGGWGDSSWW